MDSIANEKAASRVLIVSDIHIPYEDPWAVEQLWRFIRIYDPQRIVIAGDLVDMYQVSYFLTHPDYGYTLKDELAKAKDFLKTLRRECPRARIDFVCGNHDFRLQRYLLQQAPKLVGMKEFELKYLLDLDILKVNWYPVKDYATAFVDNWIDVEGVHVGHFNKANQGSGMTVRNLMTKRGGSFVQGHAHRAGVIWRRNIDGTFNFGIENPCLYDFGKAPYISDPDWQKGFTIITDGNPELIIVNDDHTFTWGGETYKKSSRK